MLYSFRSVHFFSFHRFHNFFTLPFRIYPPLENYSSISPCFPLKIVAFDTPISPWNFQIVIVFGVGQGIFWKHIFKVTGESLWVFQPVSNLLVWRYFTEQICCAHNDKKSDTTLQNKTKNDMAPLHCLTEKHNMTHNGCQMARKYICNNF